MPYRKYKFQFNQRREQLERDRQREADRLASEQNPPKYDGSRCRVGPHALHYEGICQLGTKGCPLKHDGSDPIPPEVLEARRAANEGRRKRDGEHRQD